MSEPGEGSTVCIHLLEFVGSVVGQQEDASPQTKAPAVEGETLLVIDDEPLIRMVVVDTLEQLEYRTIEAGDGPSGLMALKANPGSVCWSPT